MKIYEDSVVINESTFRIFIQREIIEQKVKDIASRINQDYQNRLPIFVIVLKGGFFFAADLLRHINIDCRVEVIRSNSYKNLMISTDVALTIPEFEIKGKDIIIIEDIVDSGKTLFNIVSKFTDLNPSSLEIATFLLKKESVKKELNLKYVGMEIASKFVVGYGLDYDEQGRHLPDIYMLD